MIGYAQLWAASPGDWAAAGVTWRGLDASVARRRSGLAERAAMLRTGWSGGAASRAGGRLDGLRAELGTILPALVEIDQVLAEFAGRLRVAKARLAEAVALADRTGVAVDRHGGLRAVPPTWRGPESGVLPAGTGARPAPAGGAGNGGGVGSPAAVAQVAAALREALTLADVADREAAGRLAELTGAARTGWVERPPPGRPAGDATPAAVRAWWDGLTPAQRRWLVLHEPARIGPRDGVPAAARDQANRLLLAGHREALLAERRALSASGSGGRSGLRRIDRALAALDGLAGRLAGTTGPRPYLLGLDPRGDGRAIVALGNPDRAHRVLTYVPGMTSDLADVPGELGRAARVQDRCTALAPGEETAAVLWLDYDAPDFLAEASSPAQARDAGPGLHRFQEGLRATHEGPAARQTVLGHSYGSLVVGSAARDHGLAADALAFVGSPGVGVDRAGALGLPPGQVWSSTAGDDVIRLVEPPRDLAGRAVLATSPLASAASLLRPDDHRLWFGHDPSDPGFGGRTFPSGRGGHTGYWEPDNPALDGMARIVLGR
ncbi:alpha/beta hydrolase [Micromonospora sp. HUAS LYJ1]|uniref:alpha/beta hydrolase n=1 Tax=Micromonospora sp. HUAS LYJ1 TaxID=3061626 RepID=UPI0026739BF4|nr:alpha/beta hydrolase [Micromonospora sp. HUAS LYJ1]WKU02437.1 alpha/beta hydrolase [Micromonospora sp. HUAS LYJ1]